MRSTGNVGESQSEKLWLTLGFRILGNIYFRQCHLPARSLVLKISNPIYKYELLTYYWCYSMDNISFFRFVESVNFLNQGFTKESNQMGENRQQRGWFPMFARTQMGWPLHFGCGFSITWNGTGYPQAREFHRIPRFYEWSCIEPRKCDGWRQHDRISGSLNFTQHFWAKPAPQGSFWSQSRCLKGDTPRAKASQTQEEGCFKMVRCFFRVESPGMRQGVSHLDRNKG